MHKSLEDAKETLNYFSTNCSVSHNFNEKGIGKLLPRHKKHFPKHLVWKSLNGILCIISHQLCISLLRGSYLMSSVNVFAGVCKFETKIKAKKNGRLACELSIDSDCPAIRKAAAELTQGTLEDVQGASCGTRVYSVCSKYLKHASCPVPSGIIKAIEVALDVALPKDVRMEIKGE